MTISTKLAEALREEIANLEGEIEQIEQRIAGLKVLLPEQQGILSEKYDPPTPRTTQRRKAAAPKQTKQQVARAKDRETRETQLLRLVNNAQGSTVKSIAEQIGLKDSTSLYRVVKRLVQQEKIVKKGQQLFTAEFAATYE